MVETLEFDGKVYRRYPTAKDRSSRTYYRCGTRILHREIWKKHNGEIPDGHHIHHKDHDPSNNCITNLECLSCKEHFSHHSKNIGEALNRERIERLARYRKKAAQWHRSPEGIEWHKKQSLKNLALRKERSLRCECCGNTYITLTQGISKYCSPACKSAARRKRKDDVVKRMCRRCGTAFECDKYKPTAHCSKKCGKLGAKIK